MKSKGFTLIDLLAAISICGIVFFAAIPGWGNWLEREKAAISSRTVQQALAAARESAALSNIPVSVCASMDGTTCEKSWGKQLIVFYDPSHSGELKEPEQLLHTLPLESGWQIRWATFDRKSQLTITGEGYTYHQNGSFYLCPIEDVGIGRRIAVNKAGRSRLVPDENGSGYSQKSDGSDMSC